jgi:hypothetical protein
MLRQVELGGRKVVSMKRLLSIVVLLALTVRAVAFSCQLDRESLAAAVKVASWRRQGKSTASDERVVILTSCDSNVSQGGGPAQ